MRIIPAIDIIDGKAVRLSQGDYSNKTVYFDNPLEAAKMFEAAGCKYLHLVDLDGAKANKIINHKVLEKIAGQTSLQIDFGGGIKKSEDVEMALNAGAKQVTGGSVAVTNPKLFTEWINIFGQDTIILGADSIQRKIASHGWESISEMEILDFIGYFVNQGVTNIVCTDIQKDGMLQGPSFDLYKEILEIHQVNLIASGGVSTIDDIKRLSEMGCEGVIVGKALFEKKISLKELSKLC